MSEARRLIAGKENPMKREFFAIRCGSCGKMKTSNNKKLLAETAKADGWKRVPVLFKSGETKKEPICPACLKENITADIFGMIET